MCALFWRVQLLGLVIGEIKCKPPSFLLLFWGGVGGGVLYIHNGFPASFQALHVAFLGVPHEIALARAGVLT